VRRPKKGARAWAPQASRHSFRTQGFPCGCRRRPPGGAAAQPGAGAVREALLRCPGSALGAAHAGVGRSRESRSVRRTLARRWAGSRSKGIAQVDSVSARRWLPISEKARQDREKTPRVLARPVLGGSSHHEWPLAPAPARSSHCRARRKSTSGQSLPRRPSVTQSEPHDL